MGKCIFEEYKITNLFRWKNITTVFGKEQKISFFFFVCVIFTTVF